MLLAHRAVGCRFSFPVLPAAAFRPLSREDHALPLLLAFASGALQTPTLSSYPKPGTSPFLLAFGAKSSLLGKPQRLFFHSKKREDFQQLGCLLCFPSRSSALLSQLVFLTPEVGVSSAREADLPQPLSANVPLLPAFGGTLLCHSLLPAFGGTFNLFFAQPPPIDQLVAQPLPPFPLFSLQRLHPFHRHAPPSSSSVWRGNRSGGVGKEGK